MGLGGLDLGRGASVRLFDINQIWRETSKIAVRYGRVDASAPTLFFFFFYLVTTFYLFMIMEIMSIISPKKLLSVIGFH